MDSKPWSKTIISDTRGITMIEMLLVLAILSMVAVSGFSLYYSGSQAFRMGEERAQARLNVRMAADFISRELPYATHVKVLSSIPEGAALDEEYQYIYVQDGSLLHLAAGGSPQKPFIQNENRISLLPLSFSIKEASGIWYLDYEIVNSGADDYRLSSTLKFLNGLQESHSESPSGVAIAYKSNAPQASSNLIPIEGTDLYRPNVEIEAGQILVFKDDRYLLFSKEELLRPLELDAKVDELNRPDLIGGSLYIPAAVENIYVQHGNETIDWKVEGHIVLEPDIVINNNNEVKLLSRSGNIIFNGSSITGQPDPYLVNITAQNGSIEAQDSKISSKSDKDGVISLEAQGDINLSGAEVISRGDKGLKILSLAGNIDAKNAIIRSSNGANAASIVIQSAGQINLDQADISSQVEISILGAADITARSASMLNTIWGKNILIQSSGGSINLSTLEVYGIPQTTISSTGHIKLEASGNIEAKSAKMSNTNLNFMIEVISTAADIDLSSSTWAGLPNTELISRDNIYIKAQGDIRIISAKISASTGWGKVLRFESTGVNSRLWRANAVLSGASVQVINLDEVI